jgi:cytochrome c oxidase assembly factor CtaG
MTPSATSFSFEWIFLGLPVLAGVAYAWAARRARPSTWRIVAFGTGLVLVAASLNSPLETISAHYLLMMHLLQNALIADLAPPLLVLGLTPTMRSTIARLGGRPLELVTRPRVALPLWLLAWYGTHAAAFYNWALRTSWPLNIEHAILIAAGLLFWWPLLAGRLSTAGALAYLGIGFATSVFLGLALIFSTRPFYSFYEHAPRLWGLSPSRDQNLGGVLMNGEQTLVFLTAIGFFLWRLLAEEHEQGSAGATTSEAERSRAAGRT